MSKLHRFLLGALITVVFTSCASTPTNGLGGEVQSRQTSPSLQSEGIRQFENMKSTKRVSNNRAYTSQVRRVGSRLSRVIPLPGRSWEFVVFEDASPNAFALPGGKVGINTGIFQLTQNDAGLAAVLGHEMAHVTSAHAESRVKRQKTLAGLGAIVDSVLVSQGAGAGVRKAAVTGGQVAFGLPHSRSHELEADQVGTLYMARAGYDPSEALNFWQRFADYNKKKGSQTPEFLRTHPMSTTRLSALKEFLPTAMQTYQAAR